MSYCVVLKYLFWNELTLLVTYDVIMNVSSEVAVRSYRNKPFAAAKKRPKRKPALNSPAKRTLKNTNNIAKINQNNDEVTKGQNFSASHTKITHDFSSSKSDILSDEENTDPPQYWIVYISNIVATFQKACVCRKCHGNLELLGIESCRAGLGTKFFLNL